MVPTSDIIVICILISISGLGFIFNTAFLIFSFVNRRLTSKLDYRWFLYGLCSIDFFYTLNMFIFQPYITLKGMDPKGQWCFITGFLVMMCAVVMAFMLGCFIIHGTSDPIVMVMVIKPYRRLIKSWFKKVWPTDTAICPAIVGSNGANTENGKLS
uniref:G-protein coupled receptors family 1 profile domain-containing protein n=1 Tax=Romanomermis culicivorax TaxID=13658 RepID=A0A915JIA9_ROMCU